MPPRPLRPKHEPAPPERRDDGAESESKSSKRRVVSSACIPCRRRKSKCDGALPACSTCLAVYRTECVYDADSDHRRKGALKRDIQSLQQQNDALDVVIASLRTLPESESISLLHSLRSDIDPDTLADTLRTNVNLPKSFGHQTLEADFAEQLAGTPNHSRGGDETLSAPWEEPTEDREHLSGAVASWFRTPQDAEFVDHLLDLYFSWVHPFHTFFSREHFLRDMGRGRHGFCSTILVNAILAFSCHYSARPTARTDRGNPSTAGDQFFAVAKEELESTDTPCLTTVQALGIMSIRETSRGRDSNGYQYAGRCVRMALELGLHLSVIGNGLRSSESEVRKITFWSVFNLETIFSVCVGRLSQLPRAAADVQKPMIVDRIEQQDWSPYVDVDLSPEAHARQPGRTTSFLNRLSTLSELASDMASSFYAPKEPFTSRRLAATYARYQHWYQNLPSAFWIENTSLPHVVVMHMYYYACVLHLFRPYIKLDLEGANLFPRDTCTSCANKISDMMNLLRAMYGLRRTCQLVPSLLLSASTIHLLNLPTEESSAHLRQGVRDLQAMSSNHRFAARCIEIIQSLASKWNIALPEGISSMSSLPYDKLPSPSASNFWTASIPQQQPFEGRGTSSQSPHRQQEPTYLHPIQPLQQAPFQAIYSDSPMEVDVNQAHNPFWTPFPLQTMPVPPPNTVPSSSTPYASIEEHGGHWSNTNDLNRSPIGPFRGDHQGTSYAGEGAQSGAFENWHWQ